MTEERWRLFFIFISVLTIFSTASYLWITPRPKEQFFQFYLLGKEKKISDYYPGETAEVPPKTLLRWYVGVTNFMGSVQYVMVRVKLGNAQTNPPNETTGAPADAPVIYELRNFLSDNETWEFPFFWEISDYKLKDGEVYVSLTINNESTGFIDVGAEGGKKFRIIFELWTYSPEKGDFCFSWYSNGERKICWLQMWFNATVSSSGLP